MGLNELFEQISGIVKENDDEKMRLEDDISIVPVQAIEFEHLENTSVIELMRKLDFLAPNTGVIACWWKIPRQYTLLEIKKITNYIRATIEFLKASARAYTVYDPYERPTYKKLHAPTKRRYF